MTCVRAARSVAIGLICTGTPPTCQPPLERCEGDAQCPAGQTCRLPRGVCAPLCDALDETSCPDDLWCDQGLCRATCTRGVEACEPSEVCDGQRCRLPTDCEQSEVCDIARPLRDPITCECVECLGDTDCDEIAREACVEDRCLACEVTASAPGVCEAQGRIAQGACCVECIDDANCGGDGACERGRCVDSMGASCQRDSECRDDLVCDLGRCAPQTSRAPCALHSECPADEACLDGQCRAQIDQCDPGCEGRCVGDPDAPRGACVGCTEACAASGCPVTQRCYIPTDQAEGWCVASDVWTTLCP